MLLFACPIHLIAALMLYCCVFTLADPSATSTVASTITSSHFQATSPPNATCKSKTINYITHSLASICLRQNRTIRSILDSLPTASSSYVEDFSASKLEDLASQPTNSLFIPPATTDGGVIPDIDIDPECALADASFLSFEDWKRQTLEKETVIEVSERRTQSGKEGDKRKKSEGAQSNLDGLVEGGDLDIDFGAFLGAQPGETISTRSSDHAGPPKATQNSAGAAKQEERPRYRSKDAGKTCKEKFNFASLDAGGQVMKSNPEAKSTSALLSENRDVYMLNTCQAKNKFFIVELSESILVETVAMANFEFFSSTFRQFRVSVSYRYPVKLDRWVEIGVFEAKNSREIQAFLVEDPRIWARYLRVEFLSHFGNEFYCPVSLLRVHGRTMIQDVLNMEQGSRGEDDGDDDLEELREGDSEVLNSDAVAKVLKEEESKEEDLKEGQPHFRILATSGNGTASERKSNYDIEAKQWVDSTSMATPWLKIETSLQALFDKYAAGAICLQSEAPKSHATNSDDARYYTTTGEVETDVRNAGTSFDATVIAFTTQVLSANEIQTQSTSSLNIPAESTTQPTPSTVSNYSESSSSISSAAPPKAQNGTGTAAHKSPTIISHTPQPSTQESFFKNVSKRLQLLEANSTLSLKYIEEQSRILREAFSKVEKRQLAKSTSFLENLNNTVLEELRQFSKQYDQIWQSTVMELETQRDHSLREIAAVSARLNILADELVLQKRMSIVQSILLLFCLAVVVFSRSLAGGYLDVPIFQTMVSRTRTISNHPYVSPPDSPEKQRGWSIAERRPWRSSEHRRQRSDESSRSLASRSQENSPPTPFSNYSGHDDEYKYDDNHDDLNDEDQVNHTQAFPGSPESSDNPLGANYQRWRRNESSLEEDSRTTVPLDFMIRPVTLSGDDTDVVLADTSVIFDSRRPLPRDRGLSTSSLILSNTPDSTYTDQDQMGIAKSPPSLPPSPQQNNGRHEFNIARKPLPALPNDED